MTLWEWCKREVSARNPLLKRMNKDKYYEGVGELYAKKRFNEIVRENDWLKDEILKIKKTPIRW